MEVRATTLLAARASLTCRTRVQDPDTKLLQQVAGSVRDSTEKNLRERGAQRSIALYEAWSLTLALAGYANGLARWKSCAAACSPLSRCRPRKQG